MKPRFARNKTSQAPALPVADRAAGAGGTDGRFGIDPRPVFAAAFATKNTWDAFPGRTGGSLGAGISMGFAEALSDDGSLTGRGIPWVRGAVCGAMTTLGGIGHTLPYLMHDFHVAMTVAIAVVLVELATITWVRHRFMDTPRSAAMQVALGGALVFATGILIGNS